tara:strand:+ start:452 stop:940 length:489 start_codon:yes stop_codon:yes gene_type:complete
MADKINIKLLKEIEDFKSGDKIILETEEGTRLLDFDNLIIGSDNITFFSTITGNSTDIAALSAEIYNTDGLQIQSLSSVNSTLFSYFNHPVGIGDQLTVPFIHGDEAKLSVTGSISAAGSLSAASVLATAPSGLYIHDDNGTPWRLYIHNTGVLSAVQAVQP